MQLVNALFFGSLYSLCHSGFGLVGNGLGGLRGQGFFATAVAIEQSDQYQVRPLYRKWKELTASSSPNDSLARVVHTH
jgi:hypothetical protein